MSFLILPPTVSALESRIRTLGASSLPQTQNFWFEDIPQIPAKLQPLPFQILTDYPNEPHELYIDGQLFKRFVPSAGSTTLKLVFNPGVYEGRLVHPRTGAEAEITFQISVRELVWWAWIQQLLSPLQRLENLEQRFNSPLHLAVFEASYPQDILALQSSQWSVRSFAQAGHLKNVSGSTRIFVSGLLGSPVDTLEPSWELRDRRADFSQALFPFVDSTVSRRCAFLAQDPDRVSASSWNHGVLEDVLVEVIPQSPQVTSSLLVRVHLDNIDTDPTTIQISGFYKDRRRFNLALDPRFVSKLAPNPDPPPGTNAAAILTLVNNASIGDTTVTVTIVGGTADLKRYCLLRTAGAGLIELLSDAILTDGTTVTLTTSPLTTGLQAGALLGLYAPTFDFPMLQIQQSQSAGSRTVNVIPTAPGYIQAGSKIMFNDDPTVFSVPSPVTLVAGQTVAVPLVPSPDLPKLTGQAGYSFHTKVTETSLRVYEYQTTPWFIAEDLDIYCSAAGCTTVETRVSIFPGETVVDVHLEATS